MWPLLNAHWFKNAKYILVNCKINLQKKSFQIAGLLIWKSRSVSNRRTILGPANLDFFLGLHLEKKLDLYHKPEKNPGDKLKKNPSVQDLKFF